MSDNNKILSLKGMITHVMEPENFASGFVKREFVIQTDDDRFPQSVKFVLMKDKTALIDKFEIGDKVDVSFNIRGNEHNDKFYVDLVAWRIYDMNRRSRNDDLPYKEDTRSTGGRF